MLWILLVAWVVLDILVVVAVSGGWEGCFVRAVY